MCFSLPLRTYPLPESGGRANIPRLRSGQARFAPTKNQNKRAGTPRLPSIALGASRGLPLQRHLESEKLINDIYVLVGVAGGKKKTSVRLVLLCKEEFLIYAGLV